MDEVFLFLFVFVFAGDQTLVYHAQGKCLTIVLSDPQNLLNCFAIVVVWRGWWNMPRSAQGFLLALHSGITLNRA